MSPPNASGSARQRANRLLASEACADGRVQMPLALGIQLVAARTERAGERLLLPRSIVEQAIGDSLPFAAQLHLCGDESATHPSWVHLQASATAAGVEIVRGDANGARLDAVIFADASFGMRDERGEMRVVGSLRTARVPDLWYTALARDGESHHFAVEQIERAQRALFDRLRERAAEIGALELRAQGALAEIETRERWKPQRERLAAAFATQLGARLAEWDEPLWPLPAARERALNHQLYLEGPAFQGNHPLHLEISLIAGCNIRCIMCRIGVDSEAKRRELLSRVMDRETFGRIRDQAFLYAESVFFGIGGEPTLHPHFAEFARQAGESGLDVSFTTNGMSLVDDDVSATCVEQVREVTVSMDGARRETFERIRSGARWDRVLRGMRRIADRRATTASSRLKIALNFALMRQNIEELPELVRIAADLGVSRISAEHLIVLDPKLADQSLFLTPKLSDEILLRSLEIANELGVVMELPDLFDPASNTHEFRLGSIRNVRPVERNPKSPHCTLLGYSVVIYPDGLVMPCGHPDSPSHFGMGALDGNSFSEIWVGRRFQLLREPRGHELNPTCANCSMSGRSDGELPVTREAWPEGWGDPAPATPTPLGFIPLRIAFLARLIAMGDQLDAHAQCIERALAEMRFHRANLMRSASNAWFPPP